MCCFRFSTTLTRFYHFNFNTNCEQRTPKLYKTQLLREKKWPCTQYILCWLTERFTFVLSDCFLFDKNRKKKNLQFFTSTGCGSRGANRASVHICVGTVPCKEQTLGSFAKILLYAFLGVKWHLKKDEYRWEKKSNTKFLEVFFKSFEKILLFLTRNC